MIRAMCYFKIESYVDIYDMYDTCFISLFRRAHSFGSLSIENLYKFYASLFLFQYYEFQ